MPSRRGKSKAEPLAGKDVGGQSSADEESYDENDEVQGGGSEQDAQEEEGEESEEVDFAEAWEQATDIHVTRMFLQC